MRKAASKAAFPYGNGSSGEKTHSHVHVSTTCRERLNAAEENGFELRSGCCRGLLRLEALTAEYRASLGRLKRDRSLLLAARTDRSSFDFTVTGSRQSECLRTFSFTRFTTLRFVLELLVVEEKLFARCEDEIFAAIYALQTLVLEFHGVLPLSARVPRSR